MIVENGKYYLYRHIRLDKNEPFYIGVGTKDGNKYSRKTTEYKRAFVKFTRNKYWKSIVNKTLYDVEIVIESNNKEFIKKKEIEFIKLYGRKDINTGVLANMTNGGDYYNNNDKVYPFQGVNKLTTNERRLIIKKAIMPILGTNPVKVFVYNKKTGFFVKEFPQLKMASIELNVSRSRISSSLLSKESYGQYIFSPVFMGGKINTNFFNIKKDKCKPVLKIDPKSLTIICKYDKGRDAATKNSVSASNILIAIKYKIKCGGFYWKYDDGLTFICSNKRSRYQEVAKICPNTNSIISKYDSIKDAAIKNNIKSRSGISYAVKNNVIRHGFKWSKL